MLFSDHNDIKSETNKNFPQIFRNKDTPNTEKNKKKSFNNVN